MLAVPITELGAFQFCPRLLVESAHWCRTLRCGTTRSDRREQFLRPGGGHGSQPVRLPSDAPLATVVGRADRSTVMLLVVVVVNRSQRQYEAKHGTKGQLV